jgi:molybdopterin/thiamine biosynthesis adenylyltransferase
MIWWIAEPERGLSERSGLAVLEQTTEWLRAVKWRLDGLALLVDFEVVKGEQRWRLYMRYPEFFPSIPPQILNADGVRISGHQYGSAGELCLEYRPDNWEPGITGAMMVESAYRLLVGESPALEGAGVESAHEITEGQRLRGTYLRLVIPREALGFLNALDTWQKLPIQVAEHFHAGAAIANLTAIGDPDARQWQRDKPVATATDHAGTAIRLPTGLLVPGPVGQELLETTLRAAGIEVDYPTWPPVVFLLVDDFSAWLFMGTRSAEGKVNDYGYNTFVVEAGVARLPPANAVLGAKKIGLVGCGSLGSKVAAMLVRSGVRHLVVMDDDVLDAGNLVRNELDWRAVGAHKARALQARLKEIEPAVTVDINMVHLGGQESSQWTATALETLSKCDLIVDATADPIVFGLCAAASRHSRRPMVWGEVFGGGLGGLVARVRPDRDPSPDVARRQLLQWCIDQGAEWHSELPAPEYGVQRDNQPPLIADDADVGAIAAHMARMIIDTLRVGGSQFPASAYIIGLNEGWIFGGPFDVYPVSYSGSEGWGAGGAPDAQKLQELVALLFPDTVDENADNPAT